MVRSSVRVPGVAIALWTQRDPGFGSERIEEFHEPSTNGDFPTRDWFPPEFSWAPTEVSTACNWDNWDLHPLLDLPWSTGYWIIPVSPEVMRTSSTSTLVPASSPWPMQGLALKQGSGTAF